MPHVRGKVPWVQCEAQVTSCEVVAGTGETVLSISPTNQTRFRIGCEYTLNRTYRRTSFLSVVPYAVGENFDLTINPRSPEQNSTNPQKPTSVWVSLGFAIVWLTLCHWLEAH